MRRLTDHIVNPLNDKLEIFAVDVPGSGNANHVYSIQSPTDIFPAIRFQDGPIGEVGINGISNEALLAIVADRLRGFQSGPFASRYNALALTHLEECQNWLNRRTLDRMARGVEGTNKE